jgi:hypothetical protein
MKPIKAFTPIAMWTLRIVILLLVYTISFPIVFNTKPAFDIAFIFHLLFLIFGILIFIGGFLKKHTMTVIFSIAMAALSFYKILDIFSFNFSYLWLLYSFSFATSLLFLSIGNKK